MFEGEGDVSGGSAADLMGPLEGSSGGEVPAQNEPEPSPEPVPATGADPAAIAAAFESVLTKHFAGQPKPADAPPAPMTPEEAKKALNFLEIDNNLLSEIGDLTKQKAGFEKFRDGIVRMVYTLQQLQLKEMEDRLAGQFSPAVQMVQRIEQEQRVGRFNQTYPALAAPELKPILAKVTEELVKQKKLDGLDESTGFKTIAEGAAAVIKAINPQFNLGAPAPKTPNKSASARTNAQSPSTPGHGGGGGGGGGESIPTGNRAVAALGKIGP